MARAAPAGKAAPIKASEVAGEKRNAPAIMTKSERPF
jgi:hypothetical protein